MYRQKISLNAPICRLHTLDHRRQWPRHLYRFVLIVANEGIHGAIRVEGGLRSSVVSVCWALDNTKSSHLVTLRLSTSTTVKCRMSRIGNTQWVMGMGISISCSNKSRITSNNLFRRCSFRIRELGSQWIRRSMINHW